MAAGVRQQVNLYQPIFRKQEKIFAAKTVALIGLVALAGLLLTYVYGQWRVSSLARELAQLESFNELEIKRLESLNQQFPLRKESPELLARLERVNLQRQAKARLIQLLAGRDVGHTEGFSKLLVGLGRQIEAGMWLTNIEVSDGGRAMSLLGGSYRPEAIPRFVQKLSGEAAFSGVEFKTFEIRRVDEERGRVEFHMYTQADDKQKTGRK